MAYMECLGTGPVSHVWVVRRAPAQIEWKIGWLLRENTHTHSMYAIGLPPQKDPPGTTPIDRQSYGMECLGYI